MNNIISECESKMKKVKSDESQELQQTQLQHNLTDAAMILLLNFPY